MARRRTRTRERVVDDEIVVLPDIYRMTYRNRISAKGGAGELVPGLISEYIPFSIVQSLGLALDPFAKFRASPVHIAPVSRTRTRTVHSVLSTRKNIERITGNLVVTTWSFGNGCKGDVTDQPITGTSIGGAVTWPDLFMETKDATARTRPAGYDYGEYESYRITVNSPTRQIYLTNTFTIYAGSTCPNLANTARQKTRSFTANEGDAGALDRVAVSAMLSAEKAALLSIMQTKALSMLPKVLPERRLYSMIREFGELKDLSRSVRQLRQTMEDFHKSVASVPGQDALKYIYNLKGNLANIPKEYIGFHFGWKQLYKALTDLWGLPEKLTKDVNRLIERKGKPTTFRLVQKYALPGLQDPPYFDYPRYFAYCGEVFTKWQPFCASRDIELRMAVNAVFDFPGLGVPELRRQLVLQKLGLVPTFMDAYNLTPWSWLLDWFTGMGDYLGAIQDINLDRSTFNYGFLTGTITGKVKTVLESYNESSDSIQFFPDPASVVSSRRYYTHTSILEYQVRVRKDIVNAYGAKSLTSGGITPYQNSIIGAILADRIISNRRGTKPHKSGS